MKKIIIAKTEDNRLNCHIKEIEERLPFLKDENIIATFDVSELFIHL